MTDSPGARDQRRKGADARRELAPKRQEIKTIENSLAKLGQERTRLEAELARLDYGRNAAHARKVTERHAARAAPRSSNWRHAGSNYPSG